MCSILVVHAFLPSVIAGVILHIHHIISPFLDVYISVLRLLQVDVGLVPRMAHVQIQLLSIIFTCSLLAFPPDLLKRFIHLVFFFA